MANGSTNGLVCQGPFTNYVQNPGTRCAYCWTIRTTLTKDGRFASYRVFCHHAGCPEWKRVHACLEAAPIARWSERQYALIQNGADWERFKDQAQHLDWVGIPTGKNQLLVFVNGTQSLDGFPFQESRHDARAIEALIYELPENKRLRVPERGLRQEKTIPATDQGLPIKPSLNFSLPGIGAAQLEDLCRRAGIETYRTGAYRDCVESKDPLTLVQALALAELLSELQYGDVGFR